MLNKYLVIDDCIKIARNYDGKIFGGYVRDVVISKMLNPSSKCEFKDIDIWFKTAIDADLFIKNMNEVYDFKMVPELSIDDDNIHYTFGRTQHHLFIENIVIWFDIVVCEWFPVDDFDVNFLAYSYKDGKELIECESEYFNKSDLINSINKKQMTILPVYMRRLISKHSTEVHVSRINKRFLSKGWRIKYSNIYFPKLLTTLWVNNTFGYKLDGSHIIYIKNNDDLEYTSVDFKEQPKIFDDQNILNDDYRSKLNDKNKLDDNNCIIS